MTVSPDLSERERLLPLPCLFERRLGGHAPDKSVSCTCFDKSASTKVSTKPYRSSGAGLRLARGTDHFNREDPVLEVYDVSRFVFLSSPVLSLGLTKP